MDQIGRYQIKKELGRGGMAIVYHAYDPHFRRDVAMKVLPQEFLHDPQFRSRFEQEAQTIASLEHPAIVPVHDFGDADGQLFLVMKLMLGGTLSSRLEEGPMPMGEIARILARLAPALDAAHAAGIVHRDLKPDNILFDQWDKPYIGDFGIVKLVQESEVALTVTGGLVGTPAYMSPEQWQGKKLDSRSDIYALGIILFQMMTGKQPYQADTPPALGYLHVHEPVPRLQETNPGLSSACQHLIDKAMAKSPEERPPTAIALADAISDIARGKTSDVVPGAEPEQPILNRQSDVPDLEPRVEAKVEPPTVDTAEPPWPRETELLPPSLQEEPLTPAPGVREVPGRTSSFVRPAKSILAALESLFRAIPNWGWVVVGALVLFVLIVALVKTIGGDEKQASQATEIPLEASSLPTPSSSQSILNGPPATGALEDTWIRPADGTVMVFVPGGHFMMGTGESELAGLSHEKPRHEVRLDGFWLDSLEVTNSQYKKCIEQGACRRSLHADDVSYNGDAQPVVGVTWIDANEYCAWAGVQLPTEAQWEYAARGEDDVAYPWGNESPSCSMAQYKGCAGATIPVGSFSPAGDSWVGAADMAGNVWEWVADWYDSNYYFFSQVDNPIGPASGSAKVMRGGGWVSPPETIRAAYRLGIDPYERNGSVGFRCAFALAGRLTN